VGGADSCVRLQEYQIANNNFKIRQLERRLAQNVVALRALEDENISRERTLFALADYEAVKCEWDDSKQKFDASIKRAVRCYPGLQPQSGTKGLGDGELLKGGTGLEEGEISSNGPGIGNSAGDGSETSVRRTGDDRTEESIAGPSFPSVEDRFMMVQSLANDQVYCSKVVERLNTVCSVATNNAAFVKLRDSYVALEADLIKTNAECAMLIDLLPSDLVPMKGDIGRKHTYPREFAVPPHGVGLRADAINGAHSNGVDDEATAAPRRRYFTSRRSQSGSDEDKDTDSTHSGEVEHHDNAPDESWPPISGEKAEQTSGEASWYQQSVDRDRGAAEPSPEDLELPANLLLRQRMREAAERRLQSAQHQSGERLQASTSAAARDATYKMSELENPEHGRVGQTVAEQEEANGRAWAALDNMECEGEYYKDMPPVPVAAKNGVQQREVPKEGGRTQSTTVEYQDPPTELSEYFGREINEANVEVAMVLDEAIATVEIRSSREAGAEGRQHDAADAAAGEQPVPPTGNRLAAALANGNLPEAPGPGEPAAPAVLLEHGPGVPRRAAPLIFHGPGGVGAPPHNDQLLSLRNILAGYVYVMGFVMVALLVPALFGELFLRQTSVGARVVAAVEHTALEAVQTDETYHNLMKLLHYLEVSSDVFDRDPDRLAAAQLVSANMQAFAKVAFGYSMFAVLAVSAFVSTYMQFLGGLDQVGGNAFNVLGVVQNRVQAAGDMFHSLVKLAVMVLTVGILTPSALTMLTSKVVNKSLPVYLRSTSLEEFNILLFVGLFVFSYLITVHVWYVTLELRRAIDRKYLAGILPEVEDQDVAVNAHGNNSLFTLLEKLKGTSYSHILKRVLIRTSITLPAFVACVVVPVRWGHLLCPVDGPLLFRLKQSSVETQIPVEMMLSHIFLPLIIEKLRYKAVLSSVVSGFLAWVTPLLGLQWILAPAGAAGALNAVPPPGAGVLAQLPAPAPAPGAAPMAEDGLQDAEEVAPDVVDEEGAVVDDGAAYVAPELPTQAPVAVPPSNPLQTVLSSSVLIMLGMGLLALSSSWVLHAPLFTGRYAMSLLRLPTHNDLFNYPVGLLICWGVGFVVQYIAQDVARNADLYYASRAVVKWVVLAGKVLAVGTLWLAVPPLILGILLEAMFVMPLRLTMYESPFFPFLQNWALGLILLKAFSK
jgi:hypothetical protein